MNRTLPRATGSAMIAVLCAVLATVSVSAADWPMWRYDMARTAAGPEELPASLHLQWTMELPVLEPAWLDEDRMEFDLAYEPIISDGMLLLASPREDTVTAYEAESGRLRWRFFTDGPVRPSYGEASSTSAPTTAICTAWTSTPAGRSGVSTRRRRAGCASATSV